MTADCGNVTGCYVEGDAAITASTAADSYNVFASAGGIAGYANTQLDSMIEACIFDGAVDSSYYAGGIAGLVRGTILSGDIVTSTARITGTYSAGGIAGYMSSGAWVTGNNVESGAEVAAEVYSVGGIVGLLETSGRTDSHKPVENNSAGATLSGEVYTGGIVGALGNNTYSGAVYGEGNTHTGTEYYAIGRDEWGQPSKGYESFNISTTTLKNAVAGEYYSAALSLDRTPSADIAVTWTFSGILPEGLSPSDKGIISGTPAKPETRTFKAGAFIAGYGPTPSADITITVLSADAPENIYITTGSILPPGNQGTEYSYALSASGVAITDSCIWYVDSGDFPVGMNLSQTTGTISGTPRTSGNYTFRVRLRVDEQVTAKTFTLTIIAGVAITTESLPDGKEGAEYSYTLTASEDNVVWTVSAGNLPNGLTLSTTGRISGTPGTAGDYSFTVQAESGGLTGSKNFTLTINYAFSILNDAALPRAKTGVWYSQTLEADADAANLVSWKLLDGALPEGLYLNPETGNISGTPQDEGTYTFAVQATAGSYITVKRFTLIVGSVLEILNDAALENGKVGVYYSCEFVTDSAYPVLWSLTGGSIPSGMTFSDGILSGTPRYSGTYTFTLTAESGGLTASKEFTITISPALSITTPAVLPSVRSGSSYSYVLESDAPEGSEVLWTLTTTGIISSDSSYTYYGRLPRGMYLDESTGTIYGTPRTEGVYAFTVMAVMGSISTSKQFRLTVRPTLEIITENILPHADINEFYRVPLLTDVSEDQAVTWSVVESTLPERLMLDEQTGILSGYILNEGTYSFTIQAFSNGLIATKTFTLTAGEIMTITTMQVTSVLRAGEYFSMPLTTDKTNGANTSWAVIDGILPPGINLSTSTGIISGTPTRAGTYTFTVQAVSGYSVAEKEFTIRIGFTISDDMYLERGTAGQPYSHTFRAEGVSAGAVLWTVSSDSVLPTGLTLSANGVLAGTTNEAGTYTFMLYAFVSNDVSAMKTMRLTIEAASYSAVPILTVSLPDGQVSKDYYAELRAGLEGAAWELESGELPEGLSLRADGLISGVPVRAGVYTFIVRVSAGNRNSTRQLSITVNAPDPEPVRMSSSGGGGCDSGFGVMGLAVLGLMFRRRKQ